MLQKMTIHNGGKTQVGGLYAGLISDWIHGSILQNASKIEPPNIAPIFGNITAEPIIIKSFVSKTIFR